MLRSPVETATQSRRSIRRTNRSVILRFCTFETGSVATIISNKANSQWYWWLYIAVICAVGYGRMFERLAKDTGGFSSQFGPPIGAMILGLGLICWLKNTSFLNVWVWRGVHICLIVVQSLAVVFAAYLARTGVYAPAAQILSFSVLLIPASIALHQYSYRSSELWNVN